MTQNVQYVPQAKEKKKKKKKKKNWEMRETENSEKHNQSIKNTSSYASGY